MSKRKQGPSRLHWIIASALSWFQIFLGVHWASDGIALAFLMLVLGFAGLILLWSMPFSLTD